MKNLHSRLRRLEAASLKETAPTKITIRYVSPAEQLNSVGTQRVVVEYSGGVRPKERSDA
jgi:hypothetical protein